MLKKSCQITYIVKCLFTMFFVSKKSPFVLISDATTLEIIAGKTNCFKPVILFLRTTDRYKTLCHRYAEKATFQ